MVMSYVDITNPTSRAENSSSTANFLFGVAVTNSFIFFRLKNPGQKTSIKSFRENLILQLIGDYCSRQKFGRCGGQYLPQLAIQQFPRKPATNNSERKRGKCSVCLQKNKRSDTQWYCGECKVWLCHTGMRDDCFLRFHSMRPEKNKHQYIISKYYLYLANIILICISILLTITPIYSLLPQFVK